MSMAQTITSSALGAASAAPGERPSGISVAAWKSGTNGYSSGVPLSSGFCGGRLSPTAKLAAVDRCCDQSAHTVGYPAATAPPELYTVWANSSANRTIASNPMVSPAQGRCARQLSPASAQLCRHGPSASPRSCAAPAPMSATNAGLASTTGAFGPSPSASP